MSMALVFFVCPGSAKAQYLTVSSSKVRDPFFGTHFSRQHVLTTNRVIQKRQGTPCTPKQCHKQRRKAQRAIPASVFGGISLGIHQTSTEPENVIKCLACDRVVKRDNIGICTRSMHRPPITLVTKVFAKYFCHRVVFQRSRKYLEKYEKVIKSRAVETARASDHQLQKCI